MFDYHYSSVAEVVTLALIVFGSVIIIDTLWLFYIRQDGEAQWVFAIDGDAVRAEDHEEFIDNLELIYQTTVQ